MGALVEPLHLKGQANQDVLLYQKVTGVCSLSIPKIKTSEKIAVKFLKFELCVYFQKVQMELQTV